MGEVVIEPGGVVAPDDAGWDELTDTGVPGTVAHCCPHHLVGECWDTGVPGISVGPGASSPPSRAE